MDEQPPGSYRMDLRTTLRQRPRMYFGCTGPHAVETCVWELVVNVIDLFVVGKATKVEVRLLDGAIEVVDDGPGLPLEDAAAMSEITQAGAFWSGSTRDHGSEGLGFPVLRCAGAPLTVRSWREGRRWEQAFELGEPKAEPRVIEKGNGRGSAVTFVPDPAVFHDTSVRASMLRGRLFQAAHLFAGLEVRFEGETFRSRDGLADLCAVHPQTRSTVGMYQWGSRPTFRARRDSEGLILEAAALGEADSRWDFKSKRRRHEDAEWWSWANGRVTSKHGMHQAGFADALGTVEWWPCVAMIHVLLPADDRQFEGATLDRLTTKRVRDLVRDALAPDLDEFCRRHEVGRYRPPPPRPPASS